ncbi:MAG: hypothetical protein WAQ08_20905 [Aquabacterium sp.]|uniref:hypothetical protein n=1 Tax=Aquabacterium sp. TaxID=1872578 RepID=UPI003BB1BCC1
MTIDQQDQEKRISTLTAAAALAGYQIARTDPTDGPVRFFATRWGTTRDLGALENAERFIRVLGGAE